MIDNEDFRTFLRYLVKLCEPILPIELYLKLLFRVRTGYKLNLETPRSFNEKLQWLKLNDIHEEYSQMVDKVTAKQYVAKMVGDKYVIPTLGVWDNINDIDWDKLPSSFVLKATGDSGGVFICKDKSKIDVLKATKKLEKSGKRNYYKYSKEYLYRNIRRRYLAEEYMEDESGELRDYKFFCFNGEPKYIQVDCNRFTHHERAVFDMNWNKLDLEIEFPLYNGQVEKPECLSEMINVASILSSGIKHVRVDLYCVKGNVYFGEMTFCHGCGMERFRPIEWDYKFGELLQLI